MSISFFWLPQGFVKEGDRSAGAASAGGRRGVSGAGRTRPQQGPGAQRRWECLRWPAALRQAGPPVAKKESSSH